MGESERRCDGKGGEDGVRAGGDGVVEEDDALGVENTECDGSGVQVDAALESVAWEQNLIMVSEEWDNWPLVTPVYPLRRGHDEWTGAPDVARGEGAPAAERRHWASLQDPWFYWLGSSKGVRHDRCGRDVSPRG